MNGRPRGFTLIEILITIGIIMVLVGIVLYGMSKVGDASKGNAVGATLGNLKAMIAELEATSGLQGRQPSTWYHNNAATGPFVAGASAWKDADPSTAVIDPSLVPGPVGQDFAAGATMPPRFDSDGVVNTQQIMVLLLAVPKNKTALGQLPPQQLLEKVPGTGTPKLVVNNPASDRTPNPPIVLDSWGNPIIFVPGSGLCGIDNATDEGRMVVNGGLKDANATLVVAAPSGTGKTGPIRSPDNRPFWASAGPDGDFRTGDDNVYSFGN